MTEAILEKAVCENCGVDVRENTLFCYNCGTSVAAVETEIEAPPDPEGAVTDEADPSEEELKELSERFKVDEAEDDRLAKAAAERKKARVSGRKPIQYVWKPEDDTGNRLFLLVSVLIAFISALAVFLTIFWR
ncbi:MAG: zinc ribbon domain-containing protein [Pyrinomonadaceae bacterium]